MDKVKIRVHKTLIFQYLFYSIVHNFLFKVWTVTSNEEFLSNTIDLRDNFSSLLVPKKSYSTSALDYSTEIDMAVSLLKSQIDNLFDSKEISDWEELGTLLKTCSFKKEKSKVLKKQ